MAQNKIKVTLQYRDKNDKVKTKTRKVKDKAELALFINRYIQNGTFVSYVQKGL